MKKLVLISGISGAGKSSASNILEDMGYTCIDQYPIELLDSLISLIQKKNDYKYDKVALTIPIFELQKFYLLLTNSQLDLNIILLEGKKEVIMKRYKFTRRVHPLIMSNMAASLEEAYDAEKEILDKFRKEKVHFIDTSSLNTKALKEKLDKALNYPTIDNLSITFEPFGFKNGVPDDADLLIDVRMLANPFYEPELKELTGNDQPVADYVLKPELTQDYLSKIIDYLDFYFAAYSKEEKRHLMVCVGCTGGQHRSVTVANYLFEHYANCYNCYINHREIK